MYRILLHKEYNNHSAFILEGSDQFEQLSVYIDEKFESNFRQYSDAEQYAKIRFQTVILNDKYPDQSVESIWNSKEYDVNDYEEEQDQEEQEEDEDQLGGNVYSIEVNYFMLGFVFKTMFSGTPKEVLQKAAEILYKEKNFGGYQVKISEMYKRNPKVVVFSEIDEKSELK